MATDDPAFEIVDTHIHWWDPANPWMLMASPQVAAQLNMGDISHMLRRYGPTQYRADIGDRPVKKVVWVMATMDPRGNEQEVRWVRDLAGDDPLLRALIGSVDPVLPASERRASLAEQAHDPRLRGVRAIHGLDYRSSGADEYMRMLADSGLIYEFMGQHDTMADAAWLAERHPDVTWVVEHCGWPMAPDDPDYVASWQAGISRLASVPNVTCKISGIAMSIHQFDLARQRPFIDHCLEAFGIERSMFGSNFPVDANYGTYDALIEMALAATEPFTPAEREGFFSANAERVYRI